MLQKAAPALAISLVLGLLFLVYPDVWAAVNSTDVGGAELKLLTDIITGALGRVLAMIVILVGIYTVAKGNALTGLFLIGAAVVFVMLPTLFNGLTLIVCPIAKSLGASVCATTPL